MEYSICTSILSPTYLRNITRERETERKRKDPCYRFTDENDYVKMLFYNLDNKNTYKYNIERECIVSEFILLPRKITREYRKPSSTYLTMNKYSIWSNLLSHFNSLKGQNNLYYSIKEYIQSHYNHLSEKWCSQKLLLRIEENSCVYRLVIQQPNENVSWFHPIIKRHFHNVVVFRFEIHLL